MLSGGLTLSILMLLAVIAPFLAACYRIFSKAGHSGWLCLLLLVPIVNYFTVLWLGFSKWPALDKRNAATAFE